MDIVGALFSIVEDPRHRIQKATKLMPEYYSGIYDEDKPPESPAGNESDKHEFVPTTPGNTPATCGEG
jgi:hypothetical protein